jgi:hypothetical protein
VQHSMKFTYLVTLSALLLLAACSPPQPAATPTLIAQVIPSATPQPSLTPTMSLTPFAQVATPLPSPSPLPPSETAPPSPTPGPVEYVIQPDDTLLFIIQQPPFNYRTFDVIDDILRLNPTILNADRLPPPGTIILIPLPTVTPTPEVMSMTATGQAAIPQIELPVNTNIIPHPVRENETILGIAEQYRTTLRILNDLNPDLVFINCDFSIPSGGESCNVLLGVGTPVFVPAPTPTPTLSPTPSGLETATPTPTFPAPLVSFPPINAIIQGTAAFSVQWVSVGVLQAGEVYLVQFENVSTGATFNDITTTNSYRVPQILAPTSGQAEEVRWRVSVARQNAQGVYDFVGAPGAWRSFTWGAG